MRTTALVIAMLIACDQPAPLSTAVGALASACLVAPSTEGDARVALQGWLDADCGAPPPGAYSVGVPTAAGVKISLDLPAGRSFVGEGVTINFVGEVGNAWSGIRMHGGRIADITLTTTGLITHDEQSHVIEPIEGENVIERVTFYHPEKISPGLRPDGTCCAAYPAGDCIRTLGAPATATKPVRVVSGAIRENHFAECDRSAWSLQRETRGMLVERNTYGVFGDTIGDIETTAGGIGPVTVRDEVMIDATLKGRSCISGSAQPGPLVGLTISNVALLGCGLDTLNAVGMLVENVSVVQLGPAHAALFRKGSDDVHVVNSLLATMSPAHRAVSIAPANNVRPGRFYFTNSQLEAPFTDATVVDATDVLSLDLIGVGIVGGARPADEIDRPAVGVRGPGREVEHFTMMYSGVVGPFAFCSKLNNVATVMRSSNGHMIDDDETPGSCVGL
jgi:hypothetical protein